MKKIQFLIFFFSAILHASAQSDTTTFYVSGQVTYYDSAQTEQGVNLLHAEGPLTVLMNMKGEILKAIPVKLAVPTEDGNIIGRSNNGLIKFDADFNIIWETPCDSKKHKIHHEITTDSSGQIYLLSSDNHPFLGMDVRFDVLKIYSRNGDLIYSWSTYDHLEQFVAIISKSAWCNDLPTSYNPATGAIAYVSQAPERFINAQRSDADSSCSYEFSHFNSIQVLPKNDIYKKIPAFKPGNLLLTFNPYACYGILDTTTGKIAWAGYLPERTTLHTCKLTNSGTILVFQNSTGETEYAGDLDNSPCLKQIPAPVRQSRPIPRPVPRPWTSISEYDPVSNNKVWEYTANPKESLQAQFFGAAQRLPNGNTLVTLALDDKGGRIFELTPQKQIVWDYTPESNPVSHRTKFYYRATRISMDAAKKIIHGFKE